MRCIALAEELAARGAEAVFLGDLGGVGWAERQLSSRGIARVDAPRHPGQLVERASSLSLSALVLDSYDLAPGTGQALRQGGLLTVLIHDGDTRAQVAHLYIDQNLGAEHLVHPIPQDARSLAGLEYVLLRDEVRRYRPSVPPVTGPGGVPRLLCFFGGTDPYGAAPIVAGLLTETAAPFEATFVAASDSLAQRLHSVGFSRGQATEVITLTDHLPRLAAGADLVISASGTSTWELLCLGAPTALVWVADNQKSGFDRVTSAGLAEGLGHLDDLTSDRRTAATETLSRLLRDPGRRHELARRAWTRVDGKGRERVGDVLCELMNRMQGAQRSQRV